MQVDAIPLTYTQKFIFMVVSQLGPAAAKLQLATCVRISGPIDVERFERASAALMVRHPILCSRLDYRNGDLVQLLGGEAPPLALFNVEGDFDWQADIMLSKLADQPFDLFVDNPFKVILTRVTSTEAYLMLVGHHLFIDDTALQILLADYLDILLADSADTEEADSNDGNFHSWAKQQVERRRNGGFARNVGHWLSYLDGADPVLHFPDRRAEPTVQSMVALPFVLDRRQATRFMDRADHLGVTNFALAATAIFHALREATGQDEILLSAISNTRRPPYERTIGDFAGMILIRQSGRNSGMADESVRLVSRDTMSALRNHIPQSYLADQVSWLKGRLERGFSMTDAYINYLPMATDVGQAKKNGYEITSFNLKNRTEPSNVPYHGVLLSFLIRPTRESLAGIIEYESAVVTSRIAQQIRASFLNALSS
jgi:hypothetical protein